MKGGRSGGVGGRATPERPRHHGTIIFNINETNNMYIKTAFSIHDIILGWWAGARLRARCGRDSAHTKEASCWACIRGTRLAARLTILLAPAEGGSGEPKRKR